MPVRFALIAILLAVVTTGCKVSQPGKFETALVQTVKQKITVGGKSDANPLPATPETIRARQKAFSHYCVACHGLDGQNTGVPFADRMSPPVPLLTSPDVQSYTDGQLKWILDY